MNRVLYYSAFILLPCTSVFANTANIDQVAIVPESVNTENENSRLFLLVFLNHSELNDLLPFQQDKDGQLFAYASDLRHIRIKIDASIPDQQLVALKSVENLKYQYDVDNQNIQIQVPSTELQNYTVNLQNGPVSNNDLLKLKPLTAAILNYSVNNTKTNENNYVSGYLEALLNSQYGNLSNRFLFNSSQDEYYNAQNFVRLDSNWQYIDPIKVRSYVIGDFISNTPSWGNSIRLAGFQWSSAYTQRSDIVTAALPQFSGSAALPSSLDLFINQQKIYSGQVPSGPFEVRSLPFISGNEITLVTKDATGQQIKTKQAYYYSAKILAKGINEFSVDVGIPRYNYGLQSNDYDENLIMGSGSMRYGYSNSLTLSSNIESSSDGLINVGGGFAKNLWNRAVLNFNLAGSQYDNEQGLLSSVGIEARINSQLSLNTDYQHTTDQYYNLARVADDKYTQKQLNNTTVDQNVKNSANAKDILRAGINWNIASGFMLSTNYNKVEYQDDQYEMLNLNLSGSLSRNVGFYATGYKNLNQSNNYGFYLGINYTPTSKYRATTSIKNDGGDIGYRQEINSTNSSAIGNLGWGAAYEHRDQSDDYATAYLNYRTHPAYLSARYSTYGNEYQSQFTASGSLVAASGRVFAANEVGDAYAIIENAGPKSHIMNGGVDLGETDAQGRFFISNLTPYTQHRIYLDPTNLPLDWQTNDTERNIMTGYRQGTRVDFTTQKVLSATAIILDKNQKPIAAGYNAVLNQSSASTIGYDGEVFMQGLQAKNTLTVDLLDAGQCEIHFDYDEKHSSTQKIGPFICQ
ncbi:fimbria/pilus outer membrane usher protein [Acinetobacter gerneri]|uniref:fimbria/pilus outer membrane usher protein n=1 Tax=Acinetobacter gerneri TaxID=202952 RepID=UPI0029361250|nr:fimbria/pilus outer membrane usher protein [Acinetobacter gerneri]MDV2440156.1 fimbria/pilus outer membrane usher protein [Acinetobacter gerneri]